MHSVQSPRADDAAIEQEIVAKGLTAPRVTPQDIESNILSAHYFTARDGYVGDVWARTNSEVDVHQAAVNLNLAAPIATALSLLTFCVLVLRNGFTVTGESACASPENFDADVGRKIARANAVNKVWPLMGYALKQQLHDIAHALPPISSAGQFRKKPIVIEAFQMTEARRQDNAEWPEWLNVAWNKDEGQDGAVFRQDRDAPLPDLLCIWTLEGVHLVNWGDWIIRGVKGELYPCKPDIFAATYEPA